MSTFLVHCCKTHTRGLIKTILPLSLKNKHMVRFVRLTRFSFKVCPLRLSAHTYLVLQLSHCYKHSENPFSGIVSRAFVAFALISFFLVVFLKDCCANLSETKIQSMYKYPGICITSIDVQEYALKFLFCLNLGPFGPFGPGP